MIFIHKIVVFYNKNKNEFYWKNLPFTTLKVGDVNGFGHQIVAIYYFKQKNKSYIKNAIHYYLGRYNFLLFLLVLNLTLILFIFILLLGVLFLV